MKAARWPEIGDLIVRKYLDDDHPPRLGLVYDICARRQFGNGSVMIEWANGAPRLYNWKHGYSCYNIQNCREEFDVIRNGKCVS